MIALIAGEGLMPSLTLDEMKRRGEEVLLLAIRGITSPNLQADRIEWLHLTQLGKAIRILKKYRVTKAVMAGRAPHQLVFSLSHLDWKALRLWLGLKDKRADTMLRAIADLFAKAGISLMSSVTYLGKYLAQSGVLTKKAPTPAVLRDIEFGVKIARGIGALDIGQTVVVKDGVVVAIEALEGTDGCLERAGQLAGDGCVVVKLAKPGQDMRFDVPVVGLNTLQKLAKIQAACLAVEGEKTLLLGDDLIDRANEMELVIVAI